MPKRWSIDDFRQGQGRDQELTGRSLWETLNMGNMQVDGVVRADPRSAAPATAAWLNAQGIPGIRYLDGMSRDGGSGTSNYVMFDDAPISIVERGAATPEMMGMLALGTGAGMAARPYVSGALDDRRKMIEDNLKQDDDGTIRSPRHNWLASAVSAAQDVERSLQGSPASLLYPEALVNYFDRLSYGDKPTAKERIFAGLDVFPI